MHIIRTTPDTCVPASRWPPHINLLYPFYEDVGTTFESLSAVIHGAVAGINAFQVSQASLHSPEAKPLCNQLLLKKLLFLGKAQS